MLSLGLLALKCWLGWVNSIPHALWAFITGSNFDWSQDLPWAAVRIYSQSKTPDIDAPSDRAARHAVYTTLHVAIVMISLTAATLTVMCVWGCIYARRQRHRALGRLVRKPAEHPGITAFTAQPDPALTSPATHGGKRRSGNAAVHAEIRSFKPSPARPMPPQGRNEPLRKCAVPVSLCPPPVNEEFPRIGTVATLSMLLNENERARAEIAMLREALVDPPPYASTNHD